MADYTDITRPDYSKVEPGDRVTFKLSTDPEAGAIVATAYRSEGGSVRAAGYIIRHTSGGIGFGVTVERIERQLPELPTKRFALLAPTVRGRTTYLLNSTGRWLNDSGDSVDADHVRRAFASGDWFVAFEGVDL